MRLNVFKSSDALFVTFVYVFAAVAAAVTIYPFIYITAVSVSGSRAVYLGEVVLLPKDVTLAGYRQVFTQKGLWTAYGNTLFYTCAGTLCNILATVLAAYPLARRHFFARRFCNFFLAFTMYFSGGLIPGYLLITNLGMYNTRAVMIIPALLSTYNVMICRSAYASLPDELFESAKIDGASEWHIFFHVAVRLITPTLAVLVLYYAVGHWNEFLRPMLYLSKQELIPMQVLLRRVLVQSSTELVGGDVSSADRNAVSIQIRYVTIVVATLPILVIYPLVQRYFIQGVMLGAVKG